MKHSFLNINLPLVLASQSPRRSKLLSLLGIPFDIIPSDLDESMPDNMHPIDYVKTLSLHKAQHIAKSLKSNSIVIGADTIVVINDKILNKPLDRDDAYKLLSTLSNNTHEVFTGIALVESQTGKYLSDYKCTKVSFRQLLDEEIWDYIDSGSPMDKAGAYGIQDDFGAFFVDHIEGCYYNIVGLPLELLLKRLKEFANEITG